MKIAAGQPAARGYCFYTVPFVSVDLIQTMPNPHYQRVLEQDKSLPAPLRWLSRTMSSWWTIGVLGVFVVGYVAAAHVPLGGRYIWQWQMFDTTQHAVLTWWPLLVAAWLLAAVVLWTAMRRLPWRTDNLGAFVAVLGLAMILVSQSWAFRSQSVGIAAVPITPSTGNAQYDALSLNYTTRYGDTHDRVLVVMVGGAAPITIPLQGLPRWNDATGEACPKLKIHDEPMIAAVIGFGTRITTKAYIADGKLTKTEGGTQSPEPTDEGFRDMQTLPYPANALLALEITTDLEDGGTKTTTAWLPFEPEGTDSLVPEQFFPVEGLGSIGLAFRPASKKLPFALAVNTQQPPEKHFTHNLFIADTDQNGRLLQPAQFSMTGSRAAYEAVDDDGKPRGYTLDLVLDEARDDSVALLIIKSELGNLFITAGLITFVLGVILDRLLDWLVSRPKQSQTPKPTPEDKGAAA